MDKPCFKKVLVANRGEIARRIIRTARAMGIRTVALYSAQDASLPFVEEADEAVLVQGDSIDMTYLNIARIIELAKERGVDAIHPGYGFLAENSSFARECFQEGLVFVGPTPEVIELMGNKIRSREIAQQAGLPVPFAITGPLEEIAKGSGKLQFPILIKAAAGGGGKGMRIVHAPEELPHALEATSREAKNYFKDGAVYAEQFIENPKHIEVQVLADHYGNAVHLFERECSVQRRHQKIIEEAPSAFVDEELRSKMTNAALKLVKETGYTNAGTIEFLVDSNRQFYFLEMNTRIQVEHPVTELITGVDMVEQQFLVAAGRKLAFGQQDVAIQGHALECRIYAEDPENNFVPSPGHIIGLQLPHRVVRIDSAFDKEQGVSADYDPMIAKFISYGRDRMDAINKMKHALGASAVHGIRHNIEYLLGFLHYPWFLKNDINTRSIDSHYDKILSDFRKIRDKAVEGPFYLAAYIVKRINARQGQSVWTEIGYWRVWHGLEAKLNGERNFVQWQYDVNGNLVFKLNGKEYEIGQVQIRGKDISFMIDGEVVTAYCSIAKGHKYWITIKGYTSVLEGMDHIGSYSYTRREASVHGKVEAPMHGKVLMLYCAEGGEVKKGDKLLVLEAMKMENVLKAPVDGVITNIHAAINDIVEHGQVLIEID